MTFDFNPNPTPGGLFDFNPVFETEVSAEVSSGPGKKSRTIPEEFISPRPIDLLDFMDRIQHSPGMIQFVQPFNYLLNWIRDEARKLSKLGRYDVCDQRFLSHIAAGRGFDLIDLPFATERERRRLMRDIVMILRRRGTLWSIRRICEDLGYSIEFDERYQVSGYWNEAKLWDPDAIATSSKYFDWNDGSMQGWTNEANAASISVAGQLRLLSKPGVGDSVTSMTLFPHTEVNQQIKFKFRMFGSGDAKWGIITRWVNSNTYVVISLEQTGGNQYLKLTEKLVGFSNELLSLDISTVPWRSGNRIMTIWDNGSQLTVIFDSTAVNYLTDYTVLGLAPIKKGFWITEGTDVRIDDYRIRTIDRRKQPLWYDAENFDKTLLITLTGTPYQDAAKREYLETIIPTFVPFGTDVQFT